MPKATNTRKARFRAALALAEMLAKDWAEQNDVSESHLSQVLDGKRISKKLSDKVDAFARKWLKDAAAA